MPALFAAASSIRGSPFDKMANRRPWRFSASRPGFTSGNAAKVRYACINRSRLVSVRSKRRLLDA